MSRSFRAITLAVTFLSLPLLIIGCMQPAGYGGSPFGNLGSSEILIIAVIILFILGGVFMKGRSGSSQVAGPTLVLRRFKIDESESANVLVEIVGRVSGFTAWLLTVMGIDAETSLIVSRKEITIKRASLSGQAYSVVPLPSVASTHCGYSKPIGFLVFGVLVLIGGLVAREFLVGIVLGAIFFIVYWLSKKIVITIETSGGMTLGLAFKRSVIENVSVDIQEALKAISIINENVVKSQTGRV